MARSVKKNFAYNAAYQVVRILTPLVTIPYLSRVLGPDNVGVYSYTNSIANYFVLFAVMGMSTYGVRAVATAGEDRARRTRVFWSAYACQLSISAAVLLAYVAYSFTLAQGGTLFCLLWGMWVLSAALDVTWLMFGVEEFKLPTTMSIAMKLGELALIFLLVKSASDLWVYIAINSGGFLVAQLALWPFVGRYVDAARPTWAEVRAHYAPNLRLFVPVVAISLYTTLDKVMLGALSTMGQTGYYEYAEKISRIPTALVTALGTVMLPRMSSVFASGDERTAMGLVEESMWVMQAAAFAMAFGVAATAPELARIFLGEGFEGSAPAMAMIAAIVPLISGSNVIGRQYLLPKFRDNQYTASVIVGAAVNIAVIVALAPGLGALGASIATVTAEATVLAVQCAMVRRELPLGRYVLNALPFVACGLFMTAAVRASAALFAGLWGMAPQTLALEIVVGALVYCALAGVYCVLTGNDHFKRLAGPLLRRFVKL